MGDGTTVIIIVAAFSIGLALGFFAPHNDDEISVEEYSRAFNEGVERAEKNFIWWMSDDNFAIGDTWNCSEISEGLKFLWYRYEHHEERWDYEIENGYIRTWKIGGR